MTAKFDFWAEGTDQQGDTFSEQAIASMQQQLTERVLPILLEFDITQAPIGRTRSAEIIDGKLVVEAELFTDMDVFGLELRPSYVAIELDKMWLISAGLTSYPVELPTKERTP